MGQFALGLRSLLVRSTIFVIMAALLAWALGGTLWPKPQTADFRDHAVQFSGAKWYWRVLVGGKNPGEVRWNLIREDATGDAKPATETNFVEVAGPVVSDDGGLYYAGRAKDSPKAWQIIRRDAAGQTQTFAMPDRLAAEQQLGRIDAGMALQDEKDITHQRYRVLDPPGNSADRGRGGPATSTSRPQS